MKPTTRLTSIVLLLLTTAAADATTMADEEIPDPIQPGATCTVPVIMSYGSYIYHWPSKFDQTFWPHASIGMIWFCEASGFASFYGDVDNLTAADKAAIASYLAIHYQPTKAEPTESELLDLLEQIYALRQLDRASRTLTLRTLAYMHEGMGDLPRATELRRDALARMRQSLAGILPAVERLEYLFVCAAYERELGNTTQSDADLRSLATALDGSPDDEIQGYVSYLRELAKEVPRIAPGGRLAPEPEPEADDDVE